MAILAVLNFEDILKSQLHGTLDFNIRGTDPRDGTPWGLVFVVDFHVDCPIVVIVVVVVVVIVVIVAVAVVMEVSSCGRGLTVVVGSI